MKYQLRYAAGKYWLLDMSQAGMPYRRPLVLNEVGARIWEMSESGLDREEIVRALCGEYGTGREMVEPDVEQFFLQLSEYGIEGYNGGDKE